MSGQECLMALRSPGMYSPFHSRWPKRYDSEYCSGKLFTTFIPPEFSFIRWATLLIPVVCFCKVRDYIEHFFAATGACKNTLSELFGSNVRLSLIEKLFGISLPNHDKDKRDQINKAILVAKMCISKFKYGNYTNLFNLFEKNSAKRTLVVMLNYNSLYQEGCNVGILVKSWLVCL